MGRGPLPGERLDRLLAPPRQDGEPVREPLAADLKGIGDVRQVELRMALDPSAEVGGRAAQRPAGEGRQRQELARPSRRDLGRVRCLLQDGVGIRAADPEGADARAMTAPVASHARSRSLTKNGPFSKSIWGFGRVMQARRDRFVLQGEHDLDEAGHARRRVQVAQIALERTDGTEAASCRCPRGRPSRAPQPRSGRRAAWPVPCAST